jgi:predicted dehydrogenase
MVKIGVIGVGFGSTVHIPAFQSENVDVVAVCASRIERAESAARQFNIPNIFTDYKKMLELPGLDAVSIVTQSNRHYEMTMESLNAGKHVLCEKPIAVNQHQAKEMLDKANATELTAMVAHEFRFAPGRAYVHELIRDGFIGDPLSISISLFLSMPRPLPGQPPRPVHEGSSGALGALGSHYIDCMRDWFGDITSVSGSVFAQNTSAVPLSDANNGFQFLVGFENGAWGSMNCSFVAPYGSGGMIEIHGTEGSLSTPQGGGNPAPDGVVMGGRKGVDEKLSPIDIPERFHFFDDDRDQRLMAFRLLVKRFVAGIETGTSPAPNLFDAYRCQQVIDAVQESTLTGARIQIPSE